MVETMENEEMDNVMTDLGITVTADTSGILETNAMRHEELDEISWSLQMEVDKVPANDDDDNGGTWFINKWWPRTAIKAKLSTKHPVDFRVLAEQNRKKLLHTYLLRIRIVMGNTDADIFDDTTLGKRQNNSAGCWWFTPATEPSTQRQRWPGRRVGIKHLHPETESMKRQHLWEKLYLI